MQRTVLKQERKLREMNGGWEVEHPISAADAIAIVQAVPFEGSEPKPDDGLPAVKLLLSIKAHLGHHCCLDAFEALADNYKTSMLSECRVGIK